MPIAEQTEKRRSSPRQLEVTSRRMVTANMLRITLGGAGLADFPPGQEGGYVKLMIPVEGRDRPIVRTYTIRHQRSSTGGNEIDVDFALHGKNAAGPATGWAMAAAVGDEIMVGGPGAAKPLPPGHEFYLVAGDMTALPAISVNLENLDPDARGLALIEVQSAEDCQQLDCPDGVEVRWIFNPQPGSRPDLLAQAMRDAGWPEGSVYAWSASEFAAMRDLRTILREEQALGSDRLYISSYWKQGADEDGHKQIKREDAQAAAIL